MRRAATTLLPAAALLALALTPRSALALGEQFGRIRGTVSDPSTGQPLPSATVVARSPALIGGPRTIYTDKHGRYELPSLPQGAYTIELSYPGTLPNLRQVEVRAGEAVTLNVAWSLEAEGLEGVSVTEARQRTRPDTTATGAVLDGDSLNRLPTVRTYQGVAQLVPGVRGGANPNIKGAGSGQNRYLIDGLDVTDPLTGTFSINLSFDSIQSVEVLTGGMDAEYNALGGVINVISRGGSDQHHATASFYVNHQRLTSSGNFGTNVWEGEEPFNDTEPGPDRSAQLTLNAGGPIIPHKLWYGVSYELRLRQSSTIRSAPLGASPYNIQHPPTTTESHQARLKIAFAPTPAHRLTLSAMTSPGFIDNLGRGDKNSYLGVAENRQNQGSVITVASWDWIATPHVNPNVQIGFLRQTIENGPQGRLGDVDFTGCARFGAENCRWEAERPRHVNLADNTAWYQGTAYVYDLRRKLTLEPSVTIRGSFFGSHDFKAGFQGQWIKRAGDNQTPGGVIFRDRGNTGPFDAGLCVPDPMSPKAVNCFRRVDYTDFQAEESGWGAGLFVRDRWWTPLPWLTVTPGLRFDYGRSHDSQGRLVAMLWALSPRLGVNADVTRDGRNVLFGYYGRHAETLSLSQAFDVNDGENKTVTNEWDGKMFAEKFSSGGTGGIKIQGSPKAPHSDELSFGGRRELVPGTVAGAEYTWKRIANNWSTLEVNRIWDPSGQRVVGWADTDRPNRDLYEIATPDDVNVIYHSVDLFTNGRPSPAWEYSASYTLSWNYLQEGPGARVSNQRQQRFDDGFIGQDLRHFLRLAGSYTFLERLTVGTYFSYATGTPATKAYFTAQDGGRSNARSPRGTTPNVPNDPKAIAELRLPDTAQLGLHVSCNVLPARAHSSLNLVADVFNVFNTRTPTGVTTTDLPTFGQVTTRQDPRRVQVAINYVY